MTHLDRPDPVAARARRRRHKAPKSHKVQQKRAVRFTGLALAVALIAAVSGWLIVSPLGRATQAASPRALPATTPAPSPAPSTPAPAPAAEGVVLSASSRALCPRAATACADLAAKVTWLQSGSRITYGPVRMEPGKAGQRTPRGTFHVSWKAGAHYVSTEYHVPIPYAVFFAAGGIAFHEGSLVSSSHGCIHLTMAAARYYNAHLPVGAEVVVFRSA